MEFATITNIHRNANLFKDTIASVKKHVTDKSLAVIDAAHWKWGLAANLPTYKVVGFRHNSPKGSYRNVAIGLQEAFKLWPNTEWFI